MEAASIYFHQEEMNSSLYSAFYESMKERVRSGDVSARGIEKGLEIDTIYLESHLSEITDLGIDHLRCALTQILFEETGSLLEVPVKIFPFTQPISFSSLRHSAVGRMFSVAGTVSRIESARPIPSLIIFACSKCNVEIEHRVEGGIFSRPSRCENGCKSSLSPVKDSAGHVFRDCQRIKIQEICLVEGGRSKPGSINCLLEGEFVNTLLPGDAVHVLGTGVAEETGEEGFTIGVKANNIAFLKQKDTHNQFTFLPEDIHSIRLLSEKKSTEEIVEVLCTALFPEIVGNIRIKEGVLLSLVGGSQGKGKRKEIHTLLIGDPGMGKSKLIRRASEILPRSNYVCGSTTTPGGLGLSMQSSGSEYVLAGGALVLSDLGHCFIDELDKLEGPEILFEAMESEEITIAKAGMVCTMPARTAVIGAANPLFGRYNGRKTLEENLNIKPEFLSRFDIVYLMVDQSNTEEHRQIARRILGEGIEEREGIDEERARMYVQYARKQIHPRISASARLKIEEFYEAIRRDKEYNGKVLPQPLTPRVVDSIVRIAEAVAKLSLREVVTKSDVEYAIERATAEKIPEPEKKKTKNPSKLLESIKQTMKKEIEEKEIEEIGIGQGMTKEEVHRTLYKLNEQGLLIKKGGGVYKVL